MLLKPPHLTLNVTAFKALASETRLDILRALDKKKMGLNELSTVTSLHKATLHEHLCKLVEAGFVDKIERNGYKWVYYKLSWQGANLLHPENSRIVILFSMALVALVAGVTSLLLLFSTSSNGIEEESGWLSSTPSSVSTSTYDPWLLAVTVTCFLLCAALLSVSFWRYRHNKAQRL